MDESIYDVFVVNVQKTVEECIALACTPSMNSLYTLKSNIENATSSWLLDFLENGGLTCLLDSLCAMTIQGPSNFSDAILQFDCLNCITTVLSTDVGMMHILELPNGLKKLTSGLFVFEYLFFFLFLFYRYFPLLKEEGAAVAVTKMSSQNICRTSLAIEICKLVVSKNVFQTVPE